MDECAVCACVCACACVCGEVCAWMNALCVRVRACACACVCGEVLSLSPHLLTRTKSPTELALDAKITSLGLGKSECALQISIAVQQMYTT